MSWSADPELQAMFLTELDERSARLVEGAHAARAETVDRDVAGAMMREGHTVKGTARVMGYDAVSVAGQLVEIVWRGLHKGEIVGGIELSRALEMAARAIPDAGRGDPSIPSADLVEAVAWLKELVPDADVPDLQAPEAPAPADDTTADDAPAQPATEEEPSRPNLELVKDVPVEEAPEPATLTDESSPESSRPVLQAIEPDSHDDAAVADETPDPVATDAPATVEIDDDFDDYVPASRPRIRREIRPTGELAARVESVEAWAHGHSTMVNAGRLFEMMNHIAELRVEAHAMVARVDAWAKGEGHDSRMARANARAIRVAAERLQAEALALAAEPFSSIVNPLLQLVKFLAGKMNRSVRLEIDAPEHLAADREVLDRLADAVRQLVVNAVFHGIEAPETRVSAGKPEEGVISVTAMIRERMLEVTVADDGAGVDWDLVRAIGIEEHRIAADAPIESLPGVLFQSGFTTRASDGGLGGGNGLDVVANAVESLYGRAVIESTLGHGTEFKLTVPAWHSLQKLLVVDASGIGWGIPEAAIDEVIPLEEMSVDDGADGRTVVWRDKRVPLHSLSRAVGGETEGDEQHVVVIRHRLGDAAFSVGAIDGIREVAVKSLSSSVTAPDHVTGAAFMGDDDIVLVVNPGSLVSGSRGASVVDRPAARVLVVDDSMGARAVVSGSLASSGFTTSVAASVAEALEVLQQIEVDALVVDYSMPHADGVALVEDVRERFDGLPIIMLSGVADEADRDRARAAGVDAFFDKADFREGALAEALWTMLET